VVRDRNEGRKLAEFCPPHDSATYVQLLPLGRARLSDLARGRAQTYLQRLRIDMVGIHDGPNDRIGQGIAQAWFIMATIHFDLLGAGLLKTGDSRLKSCY
jgi:hypothetical protein